MKHIFSILLIGLMLIAVGCSDSDSTGQDAETTVKTMDEYRAEAAEKITEENAEAELEKLEAEIAADE